MLVLILVPDGAGVTRLAVLVWTDSLTRVMNWKQYAAWQVDGMVGRMDVKTYATPDTGQAH